MKSKTYLSPETWELLFCFHQNFCMSGYGQTDNFVVEEDETDNLF